MKNEVIKLLKHHVAAINADYDLKKAKLRYEAVKRRAELNVESLSAKSVRRKSGQIYPAYPSMDRRQNSWKFWNAVNAKVEAVIAVQNDEYITIPDFSPDGSQNYDVICENCTNYTPGAPTCKLYDLLRGGAMIDDI